MRKSTERIRVEASAIELTNSQHGLLAVAYVVAKRWGFFSIFESLGVKMKKRDYSWADKMTTLWASSVVGCSHTVEINDHLGAHERALARLMGFLKTLRFPDQSGVGRALQAVTAEHVERYRRKHEKLLHARTKARALHRWLRRSAGHRFLVIDIDQRGVVVHGKLFELAERGWFGRKRGRRGYQLSLCYIGGAVGEVLDEFFDPGQTPAAHRMPEFLGAITRLCAALSIEPSQVLLRADAQYGTPPIIKQILEHGLHFLIKDISHARAEKLLKKVGAETIFERVKPTSQNEARWMTDLGPREHVSTRRGLEPRASIQARTLLCVSSRLVARKGTRPDPRVRARRAAEGTTYERKTIVDAYLTSLPAEVLGLSQVLDVYDARTTIEHYFYDEQYALGARQVRSHTAAGAALFQWIVATTNNLLKWMQRTTFSHTQLEQFGLKRLIKRAFQMPASLQWEGRTLRVVFPLTHCLVRALAQTWRLLRPKPPIGAPTQLPLPLDLDPLSVGCLRKI
jgi:hypothetical protein